VDAAEGKDPKGLLFCLAADAEDAKRCANAIPCATSGHSLLHKLAQKKLEKDVGSSSALPPLQTWEKGASLYMTVAGQQKVGVVSRVGAAEATITIDGVEMTLTGTELLDYVSSYTPPSPLLLQDARLAAFLGTPDREVGVTMGDITRAGPSSDAAGTFRAFKNKLQCAMRGVRLSEENARALYTRTLSKVQLRGFLQQQRSGKAAEAYVLQDDWATTGATSGGAQFKKVSSQAPIPSYKMWSKAMLQFLPVFQVAEIEDCTADILVFIDVMAEMDQYYKWSACLEFSDAVFLQMEIDYVLADTVVGAPKPQWTTHLNRLRAQYERAHNCKDDGGSKFKKKTHQQKQKVRQQAAASAAAAGTSAAQVQVPGLCRDYQRGRCTRGASCKYQH
jgi:hypothetical protein